LARHCAHSTIKVTGHILEWFALLALSGHGMFSLSISQSPSWIFLTSLAGTHGNPAPNFKVSAKFCFGWLFSLAGNCNGVNNAPEVTRI